MRTRFNARITNCFRFNLVLIGFLLVSPQIYAQKLISTDHDIAAGAIQKQMDTRRVGTRSRAANQRSSAISAGQVKVGQFIRAVQSKSAQAALSNAPGTAATKPQVQISDTAFVRINNGTQVQVHLYTDEITRALLDQLNQLGLKPEIVNHSLQQIQGWIAINKIDQLAQLSQIHRIKAPHYARFNQGSKNTQGDAILKANQLRAKGLRGKGIRVGIISDGANNWASAQASGDLPASGITRYGSCSKRAANPAQCIGRKTCNEGTAMAEIVHDIAPDAQLAVASASTSLEFIQRVNQLKNTFKADIIVDDLGFYGEPYFEDGDIAKAVAGVADELLYFTSAGNSGSGHYERNYRAAPASAVHDFGRAENSASDTEMGVIIPAKSSLVMLMQWNDPFSSSSNDYDLALLDSNGVVAGSFEDQLGAGYEPFEAFCYYNSSGTDQLRFLAVNKHSGSNKRLEIFTLSRGAQEYDQAAGSIFGHAGVPSVVAVGTINASEPGHNNIAFYSSQGPARIDFPSVQNRKKPDLIAIDGVNVTGAGGFPSTFFGTSAAAPHAAAVAAQLMSAPPMVLPINARLALQQGAVDLGRTGFDSTYGYGRIDAVKALSLLKVGVVPTPWLYLLLSD